MSGALIAGVIAAAMVIVLVLTIMKGRVSPSYRALFAVLILSSVAVTGLRHLACPNTIWRVAGGVELALAWYYSVFVLPAELARWTETLSDRALRRIAIALSLVSTAGMWGCAGYAFMHGAQHGRTMSFVAGLICSGTAALWSRDAVHTIRACSRPA